MTAQAGAAAGPADLVLLGPAGGGRVRTGDPSLPLTDAVAVRNGIVVAVGAEAAALAGGAHEVVEIGDGAVMAAFGDGHAHPLWGGVELGEAPVRGLGSVEQVVDAVRHHALAHPGLTWVRGGSYDPAVAPGGVFDARWLDAAVADRPVVLTSSDHHVMWCNTEALRLAGIDVSTPDPPAGEILRRPDGSPLGTLREWSAMALVERVMPAVPHAERVEGLASAGDLLAAAGVTWVQDAKLEPEDVQVYLDAARAGRLRVRANLALLAEPGRWRGQLPAFEDARRRAAAETPRDRAGDPLVTVGTVKLFADGVLEAGTAALLAPYVDAPDSCGLPVWEAAELAEAVTAFDAAGFQVHLHAIGDAGVRTALDAVEAATRAHGPRDRRSVLAHVQLVDPADVPRFAALGVVANIEPLWAQLDEVQVDLTLPRLGDARGAAQYPFSSLLASGAVLSTGSDWPVSSLRPLECLAVACTRATPDDRPPGGWVPSERLTPEQALAAATRGVAWQAFEETRRGVVLPGRRADLVLVDDDPVRVPPRDWADLPVRATWSAGERVHG